jgi:hypothetical protein
MWDLFIPELLLKECVCAKIADVKFTSKQQEQLTNKENGITRRGKAGHVIPCVVKTISLRVN